MIGKYVITRRMLMGAGVKATFLVPLSLLAGLAEAGTLPSKIRSAAPPRRLVMLDPGHGGKDPGAIGVSGIYEKHVALATAFELKRQLEAGGRYRVLLTRSRDVFVPLEHRVELADRHRAMLFVSMHADALTDRRVRGASVYTFAPHASDALTRELARRENSADRYGGLEGRFSPEVAEILASLIQRETRIGSIEMARSIVSAFSSETIPLLTHPARHAGFVVLKAADIPSVLVEMGFMSNPRDEAELRRPEHRMRVAAAMKRAVDAYFALADRGFHGIG